MDNTDTILRPISIIAKDSNNKRIYAIEEYVNWNGPMTVTLSVSGDDIGEIAINATKAIHAMEEAINKRNEENKTTTADLVTEAMETLGSFNKKEEEVDGR